MRRFRTRLVLAILLVVSFTSLAYLIFFLQMAEVVLKGQEAIAYLRNIILLVGLVITILAIVLAVIFSFSLTRGLTKPLNELAKVAEAASQRNFDQHLKLRTYSEIERLVYNFKQMLLKLKSFQEETKRHSQNLEKIASEKTKELDYIYKIGREVSSTLELDEVLATISKRTQEVLGLKICTILLVDEINADCLRPLQAEGINLKKIEKELIKQDEGISGWVWHKKESLLIKDVDQDSRFVGRKKERYYSGSLISVPIETKGKIIGAINGNNKVDGGPFQKSDLLLLKEISTECAIAVENALLYKSLKEVYLHTISALARALEAKDHYSRSHSENVTLYAVAMAEEMGMSRAEVEVIRQACQLHDLGKIGIHDYILTKAGKLTMEEWSEIKLHSLRGAQILEPIGFLSEVTELVRQHHERYDGKGYPTELSGQDILLGARIMAVADAFDAMLSERPYRQALSLSQAKAELEANSGTQFDPAIVKIFLKLLETKPSLAKLTQAKKG